MDEAGHALADAEQKVAREVVDEQVTVSGLVPVGGDTWAVYGSIPVDGEVIVAELDNRAEAESVVEQIAAREQKSPHSEISHSHRA
jgi:hypothetical protein